MNIQRLRNLTTGRIHTEMGHVYEDLELITGKRGLMIHMLPRVLDAVIPWMKENVTDKRFWDGKCDHSHIGEYELPEPTEENRAAMFERFKAMPSPLEGKKVIIAEQ